MTTVDLWANLSDQNINKQDKSNAKIKFCIWTNLCAKNEENNQKHMCCNYCKKKDCWYRCKDNPEVCKYILAEKPVNIKLPFQTIKTKKKIEEANNESISK